MRPKIQIYDLGLFLGKYLLTMIVYPNAKINLGLNVINKRTDGYHNLNTIFYPVPLCDAVEFVLAIDNKTSFSSSGIPVGGLAEDNLIMKAYTLLSGYHKLPALKIHLHKVIPMGAGLGGGSADAAFFLAALNSFFNLNHSQEALADMARTLGADCAFFIYNAPCLATERGDRFKFLEERLKNKFLILIKPTVHVSTADAYSGVVPSSPAYSNEFVYLNEPIDNWEGKMFNDFEKSVFIKYPEIKQIKERLYALGAQYASMSGSGSTVFGIFDKEINVDFDIFPANYFIWKGTL